MYVVASLRSSHSPAGQCPNSLLSCGMAADKVFEREPWSAAGGTEFASGKSNELVADSPMMEQNWTEAEPCGSLPVKT